MEIKRIVPVIILLILQLPAFSPPVLSSNDIVTFQKVDTTEVKNHLNQYRSLMDTDSISARMNLEKALEISRTTGFLQGIANTSSYLGIYYLERFNLTRAEQYFTDSFEAYKKAGIKTGEANCANNLGTISEKRGDYSGAVSYYLYAYELFDSLGNDRGISAATNNLGIVYYLLDDIPKALSFLRKSLDFKQQIGDSSQMVFAFQNLANVYFDSWNYDSAVYFYQKCVDLSLSLNDHLSAGKAYNSLGVIAMMENNYPKSSQLFANALQSSRNKNDIRNISAVYDNMGLLNQNSGKLQAATAYYDSSLTLSRKYGLKEEMKNSYHNLASVYAEQGNFRDAFLNLQYYDNLKDDLLDEKGNVAGIEALFIKQKQENKILVLEKEKERRKTQVIMLLAMIIIILVVAILGFYIYRITQKSRHDQKVAELESERFKAVIEAQEFERKRIAGDLHDSVGQMLSLTKLHLSEIMDYEGSLASEQKQIIDRSARILDEACQEVRNISHNLMPGALIRLGLDAAVKDLVRKINNSNKIRASFSGNLDGRRFDEKIEISVFRIVQEVLNNIMKHSEASNIDITLNRMENGKLELLISDNGTGFDISRIEKSSGIGWKNIYSRLSMINGTMKVNSVINDGTSIRVTI